jgi:hypothetical protein
MIDDILQSIDLSLGQPWYGEEILSWGGSTYEAGSATSMVG